MIESKWWATVYSDYVYIIYIINNENNIGSIVYSYFIYYNLLRKKMMFCNSVYVR